MTTAHAHRHHSVSNIARAGFAGLAAAVTFGVLASMTQIADHQAEDIRLARESSAAAQLACVGTPVQVVTIVGKRA